jgi:hypothetical protein
MSTSALLASTIITTFGLVGLAFVASRKGHQVISRVFGSSGLAVYRLKLFDVALVITAEAGTFRTTPGSVKLVARGVTSEHVAVSPVCRSAG